MSAHIDLFGRGVGWIALVGPSLGQIACGCVAVAGWSRVGLRVGLRVVGAYGGIGRVGGLIEFNANAGPVVSS